MTATRGGPPSPAKPPALPSTALPCPPAKGPAGEEKKPSPLFHTRLYRQLPPPSTPERNRTPGFRGFPTPKGVQGEGK